MTTEDRINHLKEVFKTLRLSGVRTQIREILKKAEEERMTYTEFAEYFGRVELDSRRKNRLVTRIKQAGLTEKVLFDDFQLPDGYGLNAFELKVLRDGIWVHQTPPYNLFVVGPHGSGKTKLAQALVTEAVAENMRALYLPAFKLGPILKNKDTDPHYMKLYKNIVSSSLLVVDDLDDVSMSSQEALAFKVLVDEINTMTSIVVTSTRPIKEWKTVFFDESFGVAVVGRLSKYSETITLTGRDFRKTQHEGFFNKFAKRGDQTHISEETKE